MNTKAQVLYMMEYIPRIFVLVGLVVIIYALISSNLKTEINISQAESEIIIQRLLYSQNGISYVDAEIGRVYPGIIDMTKFNDNALNAMINLPETDQHLAARLTISQKDKTNIVKLINQKWFYNWYPLTGQLGLGGKKLYAEEFPVSIREANGKQEQANLKIEVILPNA